MKKITVLLFFLLLFFGNYCFAQGLWNGKRLMVGGSLSKDISFTGVALKHSLPSFRVQAEGEYVLTPLLSVSGSVGYGRLGLKSHEVPLEVDVEDLRRQGYEEARERSDINVSSVQEDLSAGAFTFNAGMRAYSRFLGSLAPMGYYVEVGAWGMYTSASVNTENQNIAAVLNNYVFSPVDPFDVPLRGDVPEEAVLEALGASSGNWDAGIYIDLGAQHMLQSKKGLIANFSLATYPSLLPASIGYQGSTGISRILVFKLGLSKTLF